MGMREEGEDEPFDRDEDGCGPTGFLNAFSSFSFTLFSFPLERDLD